MQPTIHLEGEAVCLPRPYPALRSKCIAGCIFNSVGLIITRESPCISPITYLLLITVYLTILYYNKMYFFIIVKLLCICYERCFLLSFLLQKS
jgi:hypothetical protein